MSSNNIPTAAYVLFANIFTGESSDTITKMQIGSGVTAESLTDSALASGYTTNGFEVATVTATYSGSVLTFSHTFTNTGSVTRTVREAGLFSATGQLMYRKVFALSELQNLGDVPAGKSITITVTLTFRDSNAPFAYGTGRLYLYANILYNIYISGAATASMGLHFISIHAPVCYNGIPLRSAEITGVDEASGAKTWTIHCYSSDYDDVADILRFAGPVQAGTSITGKQYVTSSYRSGILAIQSTETANTWDLYANCYVQTPIKVTPFGAGWWYGLTVIQSAYAEVI